MKNKKLAVYAVTIITLVLVADFLVNQFVEGDPDLTEVLAYVRNSSEVSARFGYVTDVQVKKLSKVSASNTNPPYNLYALYVSGKDEAGLLEVKAILNPETSEVTRIQLGR